MDAPGLWRGGNSAQLKWETGTRENTKWPKLFWKPLLYENSEPKKCAQQGVQLCPLKTISAGLGDHPHTEGLEGYRMLTYVPVALCHLLYITLLQLQVVLGKARVNRPGKTRGMALRVAMEKACISAG